MRIVDVLVFKILAIVSSVVLQIILAEIVETVAVIRQVLARETKKDCFGWTHSNQKYCKTQNSLLLLYEKRMVHLSYFVIIGKPMLRQYQTTTNYLVFRIPSKVLGQIITSAYLIRLKHITSYIWIQKAENSMPF